MVTQEILEGYTNDPVEGAGGLSERELAVLILFPGDPELSELEGAYNEAKERVRGILESAVLTREGRQCSFQGCSSEAYYKITDAGTAETKQSCKPHLGDLTDSAGPWSLEKMSA